MSNGTKVNSNGNVLTLAITVVVLAIVLLFFWDRQQQRAVELRRIENRLDMMEEWGIRPQMQPNTQLGQQLPSANNLNTQAQTQAPANGGRIF